MADFAVTQRFLAHMKTRAAPDDRSERDGRDLPKPTRGPPEQPSQGDLQRKLQRLASNGGTPAGRNARSEYVDILMSLGYV